jgi:hypothetical protein
MSKFLPGRVIIFICLIAFSWAFSLRKWEKEEGIIAHDVHNYYGYLPVLLIYHDITITNQEEYRYGDNSYHIWTMNFPDGKRVFKYTCGMAILYLPFFLVAHAVALSSGFAPDGFSEPYQFFLLLSSIFYLMLGLDFCRKILIKMGFSHQVVVQVLITIGLGSNLFAYASSQAAMPHVYSFALISVMIYQMMRWFDRASFKRFVLIGFLGGLIALIRPSNALIFLVFLLYDFPAGLMKLFSKRQVGYLLLAFLAAFIVWVPQLLYWKSVTGQFWFYSYVDEQFYWADPHIMDGLFSFRKGWFVYTPLMLVACLGMLFLNGKARSFRWAIPVFVILNIYVVLAWWCWWYGGSFGQRSMIDSYALMAIPLASVLNKISDAVCIIRFLVYVSLGFLIWLNLFQTIQFQSGALHHDGMSKTLYIKQFGKLEPIHDFNQYIDWIDYDKAKHR